MALVQYDFFKSRDESEQDSIKEQLQKIQESCDKVRKGLFARHNELSKMYLEISARMDILERYVCKK